MAAASGAVALGALGQAQPTRLAHDLHAERFFVVVPVHAPSAFLTPSDAEVTPAAFLEGAVSLLLARWAAAVEHQRRLPALGARLDVDGPLLRNGGRGLPVLVILRRPWDPVAGRTPPFGLQHCQQAVENLRGHTVQASDPELRQSRDMLCLHLHHFEERLRTY